MNPTSLLTGLGAAITTDPALGGTGTPTAPGAGDLFLSLVSGLLDGATTGVPGDPTATTTSPAVATGPAADAATAVGTGTAPTAGVPTPGVTAVPVDPTAVVVPSDASALTDLPEPTVEPTPGIAVAVQLAGATAGPASTQQPVTTDPQAQGPDEVNDEDDADPTAVVVDPLLAGAVPAALAALVPSALPVALLAAGQPTPAETTTEPSGADLTVAEATSATGSAAPATAPVVAASTAPTSAPVATPASADRVDPAPSRRDEGAAKVGTHRDPAPADASPTTDSATPTTDTSASAAPVAPATTPASAPTSAPVVSGPAATTATAATAPVTGTTTADPHRVVDQVFDQVIATASGSTQETSRVTVRLNPENLGEVRVVLTHRRGELHVSLAAGGDQARLALAEGSSELGRLLASAGHAESRIVVRDLAGTTTPAPTAAATGTTDLTCDTAGWSGGAGSGAAWSGTAGQDERQARTQFSGSTNAMDGTPVSTNPSRPSRSAGHSATSLDLSM